MLIIAQGPEINIYPAIAEQMYRLRALALALAERRGWRVTVTDGKESDRFDDQDPLYFCLTRNGHLLASVRLLPTTAPHMLSDVLPEIMGTAAIVCHPLIWESSRFSVDAEAARSYSEDGLYVVTREILESLFTNAHAIGLSNIISVYNIFVERILRRAGYISDRLGPVVAYDDLDTVGGLFEVSDTVIKQLKSTGTRHTHQSIAS